MSAKNGSSQISSNKLLSTPIVSLKKLAKSANSGFLETYDFKSPKLVPPANKTPLKIKTNVRASIENLLVQAVSENPKDFLMNKVPYQPDSHRAGHEGSFNDQKDSKDSTMLKDSNGRPDLKDLKDQKDAISNNDSPLNSYKGSFLENTNEGSPQETKMRSGSIQRKSSTFEKGKLTNSFFGKAKNDNRKSFENSPSKISSKSNGSKDRKNFTFNNEKNPTPNTSFIKEKAEKDTKNPPDGAAFFLYCF